jgi:hypothetical protein
MKKLGITLFSFNAFLSLQYRNQDGAKMVARRVPINTGSYRLVRPGDSSPTLLESVCECHLWRLTLPANQNRDPVGDVLGDGRQLNTISDQDLRFYGGRMERATGLEPATSNLGR